MLVVRGGSCQRKHMQSEGMEMISSPMEVRSMRSKTV